MIAVTPDRDPCVIVANWLHDGAEIDFEVDDNDWERFQLLPNDAWLTI